MTYSFKDFTGQNLSEYNIKPQEIRGSCFSQEEPDSHIFPEGMTGVTFLHCNLMNVFIPDGNTVINCQTQRFKCQNDGHDWEIDDIGPTNILNYKLFNKAGITVPSPAEIPDEKAQTVDYLNTDRNVKAG